MKKEDIQVLAQLLEAIKENVDELEDAQKKRNSEKIIAIRKEIMNFQKKIEEML